MVPAMLSPTLNAAPKPWIDRVPLLAVVELVDAGAAVDIPFPPELVDVTVTIGDVEVAEVDTGAELSELVLTLVAGGMIVLELVELLLGAGVDEVVVEG